MQQPRFSFSQELAVFLGVLMVVVFISPVADWWSRPSLSWLTPYALWLLIILGALLIHRLDDSDEP